MNAAPNSLSGDGEKNIIESSLLIGLRRCIITEGGLGGYWWESEAAERFLLEPAGGDKESGV